MDKCVSYLGKSLRNAWNKKIWQKFTFFTELKKQDGQEYEPHSPRSVEASIDRYLRECDYIHSILTSREFASLKALLEGKAWVIFKDRKGRRPN